MRSGYLIVRSGFWVMLFFAFAHTTKAQSNAVAKIRMENFQVTEAQNKIKIHWSTNSKATNYFEVQKSVDGKNFKTIAYVLGPDPAKPGCECFGCFDKKDSKKQISYYRLKHLDFDGNVQFSEIKMLALK
ncbi:MAG TPA: hypothetical protein VFF23_10865 [Hanamia sp.]|jgi:hypothetical protein|nr:hypothetical protein [Hanamia sp.]